MSDGKLSPFAPCMVWNIAHLISAFPSWTSRRLAKSAPCSIVSDLKLAQPRIRLRVAVLILSLTWCRGNRLRCHCGRLLHSWYVLGCRLDFWDELGSGDVYFFLCPILSGLRCWLYSTYTNIHVVRRLHSRSAFVASKNCADAARIERRILLRISMNRIPSVAYQFRFPLVRVGRVLNFPRLF